MKQCSLFVYFLLSAAIGSSQQINISGPAGSGQFGTAITVLTNGNYVITDPGYDDGAVSNVGAVYLYSGSDHTLISMLKGSTANDAIGSGAIAILSNGNYVVISPSWDNGAISNAGAATFGNRTTGVSGVVSAANSLVGSTASDQVGGNGVALLNNGNYVVVSPNWDNGAAVNAGAVTFGNGVTGVSGIITGSNSLIGTVANDVIGISGITILSNGNYVIGSSAWHNGPVAGAGAVTFGNKTTGISGIVSATNSLVGTSTGDIIGNNGIIALSNGNYLVKSTNWSNGAAINAGALTFGNGTTGTTGAVSASNSLVGTASNDNVGSPVTVLNNGNYVVRSQFWDNGAISNAGAVTWGSGTTGVSGAVSSLNSLVGTKANDLVGSGIVILGNGNYVITSVGWDNGAIPDAGAATFGSGTTGVAGIVSAANSLVGSKANDNVGTTVTALTNNNYVVASRLWDNGAVVDAGAATFANGTTGISGIISAANSMVGSKAFDNVANSVTALTNGNYVVRSDEWDNGAVIASGAVTWCNGTTGTTGAVSSSNSLTGKDGDRIGSSGITALTNGNYVVISTEWSNTEGLEGAVTWGNGATGTTGLVTSSNSLVGSSVIDRVGNGGVVALSNGNYVVRSSDWGIVPIQDIGAVTWGNGATGTSGIVSAANSLVGSTPNDAVGSYGITALPNGNYLVNSANWDNGAATNAGAVTFGNGITGVTGVVSVANSLVGSKINDAVGSYGNSVLSNGNYIVRDPVWDNGAAIDAGAVTFGNGTAGVTGIVSAANSLVGSKLMDFVGINSITIFSDNNYVVSTPDWDNGAIVGAGAISFGNGSTGVKGIITSCNSIIGGISTGNFGNVFAYNTTYNYLLGARFSENIVTVYNPAGMALANHLDATTVNIIGINTVPLIANSGCRIIAILTPNGGTPVKGTVNAQAWVEPAVPTYAGEPFVARHVEITPASNASTVTGKVTLYFTQQEFTDFNNHVASILDLPNGDGGAGDAAGKANLRIGKYAGTTNNGSGLPGTYPGSAEVIDPNDADIVWNSTLSRWEVSFNVTGFSGFIVQTSEAVLPLTVLEFNGRLINNNGLLNWKTTDEINTTSFDIERSIDGINYAAVGNVAAMNTPGDHQYSFTDNNITSLGAAIVYYRLKQKDIDGRFTYSGIVALVIDNSKTVVSVYPNPVLNVANLAVSVGQPQPLQARIIDNAGRVVKQLQWNIPAGSTSLSVDVSALAKGMYYLELKGETINERKQLIKQ